MKVGTPRRGVPARVIAGGTPYAQDTITPVWLGSPGSAGVPPALCPEGTIDIDRVICPQSPQKPGSVWRPELAAVICGHFGIFSRSALWKILLLGWGKQRFHLIPERKSVGPIRHEFRK